ncbi:MAG: hypothetical protein P8Y77_04040 [Nitrospirota bacterium]
MLRRAIALAVVLAFSATLPFVGVCFAGVQEDTIAMLDLCTPDAPGTTSDTMTIVEPVFTVPSVLPVAYLPAEKTSIPDFVFFSPIDKPPVV